MKHNWILSLIMVTGLSGIMAQSKPADWLKSLPAPYTLSEAQISEYLQAFQVHYPDFQDRVAAIANWRVGTPYKIYQLGEECAPDTDPIIRLDVSDCTAHILTTLACAHSSSWSEARQRMIEIHYKPDDKGRKIPSYKTRWHYTLDRITNNPYTVNITETLLPKSELEAVTLTLNRQKDGSEFLDLDWNLPISTFFIPNRSINAELLKKLPPVCGVDFVKKAYLDKGILIAHEGMILDNVDVLHASSSAGKTVRLPFLDYYFGGNGPIFDGIMISRFVENK